VQVTLARDRDRVTLTVADRGLGIDASDLPHIFKPFYRGRRAVEAQIRGTGIGLSVVRHVVEGHHGNVHVDSRAGEGTTVTISLPAAPRREGLVGDAAPRAAT
jgi:two-component system phosphate regulon sensor histidine kinase PhoR